MPEVFLVLAEKGACNMGTINTGVLDLFYLIIKYPRWSNTMRRKN